MRSQRDSDIEAMTGHMMIAIDKLRAENERLRAALVEIRDNEDPAIEAAAFAHRTAREVLSVDSTPADDRSRHSAKEPK